MGRDTSRGLSTPDLGPEWTGPRKEQFIGSLMFVQFGQKARAVFKELGVEISPQSRLPLSIQLLSRVDAGKIDISQSSEEQLEELSNAQRTVWEFLIIAAAAYRRRKRADTPFTAAKLEMALKGTLREADESNREHRNTQFELYVAAQFVLGGLEVNPGEPDLKMLFWGETVGVAAKRMGSTKVARLDDRLKEAVGQVEREIANGAIAAGFIALNLDVVFRDSVLPQDIAARNEEFQRMTKHLWSAAANRLGPAMNIRGVLIFGFLDTWDLSGEMPTLRGAYPTAVHMFGEEGDPALQQRNDEFWAAVFTRSSREVELLKTGDWEP